MAKKADVRVVARPFELDGVEYAPGDEFAVPSGWSEVEPLNGQDGVVFERKINEVRVNKEDMPIMGKIVLPLEE